MTEQPAGGTPFRLEDLQIVARPRRHWEALDLGVLIARRWYRLLLTSWLCLALPAFVGVFLLLPEHPGWALFVFWWFKPLYERIPLKILSAAIFRATPTLSGAFRETRGALQPGMLQALTYKRLSPNRSFEAPVWVLEGLAGHRLARRFALLRVRAGSGAFWLTVLGVHIESFLVVGMITGVYLFIPSGVEVDWWGVLIDSSAGSHDWLINVFCLIAMAVIAPVYVASGFALYLNRRVELEGWDIELGFRRLAQRALGVAVLLLAVALPPPGAMAADDRPDRGWLGPDPAMEELSDERRESREGVRAVLAGPDFNVQSSYRYPRFLDDLFDDSDQQEPEPVDLGWLSTAFPVIAQIAEVLLWALVLGLLLWVALRLRLLDLGSRLPRRRPRSGPAEVLGLAVSVDSLPDDVPAHALRLWRDGARREAMSLVYRGALSLLINRYDCRLTESDTEGDCLGKAGGVLPPSGFDYFRTLTRTWQRLAYAHAAPADAEFEGLCRAWAGVFQPPSGEPADGG